MLVKVRPEGWTIPVELGASWVHDVDASDLADELDRLGVATEPFDYAAAVLPGLPGSVDTQLTWALEVYGEVACYSLIEVSKILSARLRAEGHQWDVEARVAALRLILHVWVGDYDTDTASLSETIARQWDATGSWLGHLDLVADYYDGELAAAEVFTSLLALAQHDS